MQIAIVVYPGMTALDAVGPYEVLRLMPDAEIRFVAAQTGPVVTDSGVLVLGATHTLAETPAPDIVLVPGSEARTLRAMNDRALLAWLNQVHEQTRWTLSVCSGAFVLAAAGILRGRPATTHWLVQKLLTRFGVEPRPSERIVRSGRIASAAGVSAGIDLALWLVREMHGRETAEMIQLYIEYDPQPPVDAGHPDKASKAVRRRAKAELLQRNRTAGNVVDLAGLAWHQMIQRLRHKGD